MGVKAFGFDICPLEIFTGDNAKLSTTKIWTNISYATMTYKIWTYSPGKISWEYVAWNMLYLAIVGSSYIAAKWLDMRFTGDQPPVTVNQPSVMNVAGNVTQPDPAPQSIIKKSGKKK